MNLFNKAQLKIDKNLLSNLKQSNQKEDKYIETIAAMQLQLENVEKHMSGVLENEKTTLNGKILKLENKIKELNDKYGASY